MCSLPSLRTALWRASTARSDGAVTGPLQSDVSSGARRDPREGHRHAGQGWRTPSRRAGGPRLYSSRPTAMQSSRHIVIQNDDRYRFSSRKSRGPAGLSPGGQVFIEAADRAPRDLAGVPPDSRSGGHRPQACSTLPQPGSPGNASEESKARDSTTRGRKEPMRWIPWPTRWR